MLWDRFVWYAKNTPDEPDSLGFCALSFVSFISMDAERYDPAYIREDNSRFVRDLGRLLIALYPEMADLLWCGERNRRQIKKEGEAIAETLEENFPGFSDPIEPGGEDPYTNPDYMVFPELFDPTIPDLGEADTTPQ